MSECQIVFSVLQEAELRVDVLQHHAALIGGPNATSCPICHKLFLGADALMEHMKHTHKDNNAGGVSSKYKGRNGALCLLILLLYSYRKERSNCHSG